MAGPVTRHERCIKASQCAPVLKSLETFEFNVTIPSVNKRLVLELTRSE